MSVDTLLESVELDPRGGFATAYSDGGYTTNLRLPDLAKKAADALKSGNTDIVGASYKKAKVAVTPGGN